ncbi:MAG: UDP-N-acetylmuramate--L-alanine ligase [Lachnospiraceae bacterium]|nr:UDP-N-acetylmuramate--L-alanine ligase [Lachnospiraceae bacterium]
MYTIDFEKKLSAHFIGIGGISMSGLAEILLDKGFSVTGSDRSESDLTKHLVSLGAKISYPQKAENVSNDTDFFVYTAAIHPDNEEYKAAKATNKPMLTRAELLGQVMEHFKKSIAVAGTHGKTTTTSMISQVLLECDTDPTISVGAIFSAIKSNVRVGQSDYFVTEACEYTDSFLSFYPMHTIILNIDAEHLDYFKTLENERKSFHKFASNTKKNGFLYINGSIPNLSEITDELSCKVITFGLDDSFDYHAKDITYDELGHASFTPVAFGEELPRITLHVPGKHNVSNSLSAIATLRNLGLPYELIQSGLSKFTGADRRFQYKGRLKNGAIVVDDYAHHPTEIKASLDAALHTPHNRLIVAFQPHTYTRTKAFLNDFADALSMADIVVLADIYAAREQDIYGVSSEDIKKLIEKKNKECHYFHTFDEIETFLEKNSVNGDLLITMGAGNILEVGENLLKR